jgi:hypothetical protein
MKLVALLLIGCRGEPDGTLAIVDASRPTHFFDLPFPSDDLLRADGTPELVGFPSTENEPAGGVVAGWVTRLGMTQQGFGNLTPAWFRFEGPLDLPTSTDGLTSDPVLWIAVGGTALDGPDLLPLDLRFVTDPQGDPFLAEDLLVMAPQLAHPPVSGGTYAAVVMESAGVTAPADYALPDEVQDALERIGVDGPAAVATVFTVQDATDQLQQLFADVDARLGTDPDWGTVTPQRVVRLDTTQGLTESGEEATVVTAVFEDGTSRAAYLAPLDTGEGEHSLDLGDAWPMAVYELEIPTLNYQGLAERPYMRPSFTHVLDTEDYSGWIDFSAGLLQSTPEVETMRVVVSIPKGPPGVVLDDTPVLVWDHGTGGHAYNSVQRRNSSDNGPALASVFASAGVAVVGRDAALYGTRYPLIDEGFGASLGFYNIVNAPAFRDNQRQTAVDGHVLLRFLETGLNDVLPEGSVDADRPLRFGHSMGSVTANLGLAADPDAWDGAFLSGSGGNFTTFFLDTGLLADIDPSLISGLFALFGAEAPDEITTAGVMGAALGLDEAAWPLVDRMHPVIALFQWSMDASDPLAVARDEALTTEFITGIGDLQVPNHTTEALVAALPDASLTWCTPTSDDYDPHVCLHREAAAWQVLADWLAEH